MELTVRNVVRRSWDVFKAHWGTLWLVIIIFAVVESVMSGLTDAVTKQGGGILVAAAITVIGIIVSLLLRIGLVRITLTLADDGKASLKELYLGSQYLLRYLFASILYGILVIVGFLLLLIPGIYWSLKYGQYRMLIVDKNLGVLDSFKESARITADKKWKILLVSLAYAGLMILSMAPLILGVIIFGVLSSGGEGAAEALVPYIPFVIGIGMLLFFAALLVLVPMTMTAPAILYRMLLGTHVAQQGEPQEVTGEAAPVSTEVAQDVPQEEQKPFVALGKEEPPKA